MGESSYPPLASPAELVIYGMPETALVGTTGAQQLAALQSASDEAYSYLSGRFAPPYVSWDISVTIAVCKIAAWELLNIRGYDPGSGADINIQLRATQARSWLGQVQRQAAHPKIVPAADQSPTFDQPEVVTSSCVDPFTGATDRNRGW